MKSIFHHFRRATIEANKKVGRWESDFKLQLKVILKVDNIWAAITRINSLNKYNCSGGKTRYMLLEKNYV